MKRTIKKLLIMAVTAVMILGTLAGCGSSSGGSASTGSTAGTSTAVSPGSTGAEGTGAEKTTVTIGSKPITESFIVGEMEALLLEEAGYKVERKFGLGSTMLAHEALMNGDIDMYIEYNGTSLMAILQHGVVNDPEEVNKIVKEGYDKLGISMLKPLGFNNTYCITVTSEFAKENNLKTISDIGKIADKIVFGSAQEFIPREDGLKGMEKTYGFNFGKVKGMDPGLMYKALETGSVNCVSGFATDGQISANNLVNLEDDKQFFPPYDAMPVISAKKLEANPEIADVLDQLAGKLDDKTMSGLNYRVDSGEAEYDVVAKDFLKSAGLIK